MTLFGVASLTYECNISQRAMEYERFFCRKLCRGSQMNGDMVVSPRVWFHNPHKVMIMSLLVMIKSKTLGVALGRMNVDRRAIVKDDEIVINQNI